MSSISNKNFIQSYTLERKIRSMPKSRLPELIDKARSGGLSFRDIQRRAGGDEAIALSTLNQMHKGRSDNLTLTKILALAKGLGESPTVIFEAAIGKSQTGTFKDDSLRQLLEDFGRLQTKDRDELKVFIDTLKREVQDRLNRNT